MEQWMHKRKAVHNTYKFPIKIVNRAILIRRLFAEYSDWLKKKTSYKFSWTPLINWNSILVPLCFHFMKILFELLTMANRQKINSWLFTDNGWQVVHSLFFKLKEKIIGPNNVFRQCLLETLETMPKLSMAALKYMKNIL